MEKRSRSGRSFILLIFILFIMECLANPLFDPCPNSGMRKPPRFGKRDHQILIDPCLREPERRNGRKHDNHSQKSLREYRIIDALIERMRSFVESDET